MLLSMRISLVGLASENIQFCMRVYKRKFRPRFNIFIEYNLSFNSHQSVDLYLELLPLWYCTNFSYIYTYIIIMGLSKAHKLAQRLHRERRQPEYRKKFGYLEKKADYKARADDHHKKADRLKKLKNRAQERNPNEFHFHMINSRIVDGSHQEIARPMDRRRKKKIVQKEELLKRYNETILSKREEREKHEQREKVKRKHIKFV